MKFLKKHKSKIFILIFIFFTAFTIYDTYSMENETENDIKTESEITEKETKDDGKAKSQTEKVLVDVKGEINTPGVYELTSNNTVIDAINKAGGLTKNSDTSNINLSKKLENEMVIIVYSKSEIQKMEEPKIECPPCNDACIKEDDEKAKLDNSENGETSSEENSQINGKININTATSEQLQTLDGIGESKAKAIIDYREKNGNFKTIEDLKNVSGIGDSVYEKIKNNITV